MSINARGGLGGHGQSSGAGGGGGAGGAVRLIANTITGSGTIDVSAGSRGGSNFNALGGDGAAGYVRAEAYDLSSFTPNVPTNSFTSALPNPVAVTNALSLRIASVAGVAAPTQPLGSLVGAPDIALPAATANPVTVAIEAAGIPVGTTVQVTLIPNSGARTTAQSSPLAGTQTASTATASVNLPAGMSVLTATTTVDFSQAGMPPLFRDGERVLRAEIAAVFGGTSEVTYITETGRRIKKAE
jgi:hypothetical protein